MSQTEAEMLKLLTAHGDRIRVLERRLKRVCEMLAFFVALVFACAVRYASDFGWPLSGLAFAVTFGLVLSALLFVLRQ